MANENQPTTSPSDAPILSFEGKRYDINSLPDDIKQLVIGMQTANAQIKMHEDTLKLLSISRQTMARQLNERLRTIDPLPEAT
ncbi:MAG: hypothetical protein F4Z75_05220 [Synechococcus sp. SB0668_bin_15]|nr:hypothetical protein [Synechococcus sp. SB0668_bin_15]MXZ83511.1 hypothetical protein [Synechococcus sp. SB0666_bin_14]MYA90438.1 hypothetical protein [Synechococcus sp. SB0663_bin_10]MYC49279.1 hypothetical protein [Synechococcus sp. SB0662_bin_14]MYG47696.1 hypothetical protein [Synechococcus sp. SB0675_bin_6]MYJ59139.1 hypothetical protein [Synechococcus sp. SB0672_bin_6]